MKTNLQKYHLDVLSTHNNNLYNELIYEHDVSSGTLKEIKFECGTILRGYFAVKDKQKYWVDENLFDQLPIKPGIEFEEYKYQEDVILRPLKPIKFKISPKEVYEKPIDLLNDFVPFEHSAPAQWTLLKLVALSSYISKVFVCVSSNPEFGKSSVFEFVHGVTNLAPVFKPRSVPGVLNKINSTGAMVFDDVLACDKKVRDIMEEFCLQIGGGKSVYINGAMKSNNTKSKYNCRLQSIVFLYNNLDCYMKNNGKVDRYFEDMFDNNVAIDTRFLKLRFEGRLTEEFEKSFSIEKVAEQNKMFYINFAKHLLWLQEMKSNNGYEWKNTIKNPLKLNNRKQYVYNEILWLADYFAPNQEWFDVIVNTLNECINEYSTMVLKDNVQLV